MDDKAFSELQLQSLFLTASKWPATYMHQKALTAAANECTALVREAQAKCDEIDAIVI
jgi:hypothetical protein